MKEEREKQGVGYLRLAQKAWKNNNLFYIGFSVTFSKSGPFKMAVAGREWFMSRTQNIVHCSKMKILAFSKKRAVAQNFAPYGCHLKTHDAKNPRQPDILERKRVVKGVGVGDVG